MIEFGPFYDIGGTGAEMMSSLVFGMGQVPFLCRFVAALILAPLVVLMLLDLIAYRRSLSFLAG